MKGLNRVQLIGNVSRAPEVKYVPSGTAVAKFGLATTERFKNKQGEWTERAEFHNLIAWGKTAEMISERIQKGGRIYVEGKIQTTSYEKDGSKRYFTEIVVDQIMMLDSKPTSQQNEPSSQELAEDSVPF